MPMTHSDKIRSDSDIRSYYPDLFTKQLERVVGGHAILHPIDSERYCGNIGDCATIYGGTLTYICNVYDQPLDGLPKLERPPPYRVIRSEPPNRQAFTSSRHSEVKFSGEASIPIGIAPIDVTVSAQISVNDDKFAFLSCAGPYRVEEKLDGVAADELGRYTQDHYAALREKGGKHFFVIEGVLKASGWVSGVAERKTTFLGALLGAKVPLVAGASVGGHWAVTSGGAEGERLPYQRSEGPHDWTPNAPHKYTVVVWVQVGRNRDELKRALGLGGGAAVSTNSQDGPGSTEDTTNTNPPGPSTSAAPGPSGQTTQATPPTSTALSSSGVAVPLDSQDNDDGQSSSITTYDTRGEPVSKLLYDILGDFLTIHSDVDFAFGSTMLLSLYYESHKDAPRVGHLSYEWKREDRGGKAIATLTALNPSVEHQGSPTPAPAPATQPQKPQDSAARRSDSDGGPQTHDIPVSVGPPVPPGSRQDQHSSLSGSLGYVQKLHNWYQGGSRSPALLNYSYDTKAGSEDTFSCALLITDRNLKYTGSGRSRRAAQEAAAKEAVEALTSMGFPSAL
ncbi:hypothetical protein AURDEDRAFT_116770, partial [Auricularia subglabra TFB-10046 SS5]